MDTSSRLVSILMMAAGWCVISSPGSYSSKTQDHTDEEITNVLFLRRQILNYVKDKKAYVTVAYQTNIDSDMMNIRWFRKAKHQPHSELKDMLTTEGDGKYKTSTISSGSIRATTLMIKRVRKMQEKLTLVITIEEKGIEYQIDVIIDGEKPFMRERITGVRWLAVMPPTLKFGYGDYVQLKCTAMLDGESEYFLDELRMYRKVVKKRWSAGMALEVRTIPCVNVTKQSRLDNMRLNRKHGSWGSREIVPFGYFKYDVNYAVDATRGEDGMYVCAVERKHDRTYISSWTKQNKLHEPARVELVPCKSGVFNNTTNRLHMSSGVETCFRCVGYGYPLPEVEVKLNAGTRLQARNNVLVNYHRNIAEGGRAEVTYTFLKPSSERHTGQYFCNATSRNQTTSIKFHIAVV